MTGSFWPLFDLVLTTPRLVLRVPRDDDFPALLDAVDAGIHDPAVMPFSVPWTDVEPAARRRSAAQHWWSKRVGWTAQEWHLELAVFVGERPVGIQAVFAHDFAVLREVGTGSWLTLAAQGQGLGKEMRAAVLQLAFEELGARRALSGAFRDNPASLGVSRALGYRENGIAWQAPRGEPRELVNLVLARAEWERRRDGLPRAVVTGLDACRDWFGLAA